MAAIDFPNSPSVNDTFTANNRTWTYVGNGVWDTVEVATVAGPTGPQGDQGPANVLSVGTVSSTGPDNNPTVTITGDSPAQTINFSLKQGPTGPPTSISIGTVTTSVPGSTGAASITGPAGNQVLSLTVPQGPTGPSNTLSIGTVTTANPGATAAASITGTSPSQTLNLTIPQGPTGPSNTLTVGTVSSTGPDGTPTVSITGASPSQTINFVLQQGPTGPAGSIGTVTINDLSDVTVTGTPLDGQLLTYDTTTSQWINSSDESNLKLLRVNSAEEGGEISLARASDNASYWFMDVFGSTSTPSLRFIQDTSTRMSLDSSGLLTAQPAIPTNTNSADNVGYVGMPQSIVTSSRGITAADAGKHLYVTTTGQTITIPANSSVPLEIGTTIVIVNAAAVSTSIAITTDTLLLGGAGTTGTRTLAAHGVATLIKLTATSWIVSGNGVS